MWHEAAYEAMPQFCGKGDSCIVDVGANVGFYAMRRSLIQKDCRIYCFEPSPSAFSRLKRNIEANGLSNIEAFNWAIGNHSGFVRFDEAQQSIQSRISAKGKIEVTCKALDDVVRELNILRIDTLKITTEGHERFVLEGAKATLAKVARVVLEVHGDIGERSFIKGALHEAGFHLPVEKGDLVYYERNS
jgi:FkbM family methyltransferase